MGLDACLRRPVVVGTHGEDPGGTKALGLLGEVYRVSGVVGAGAGNNRDGHSLDDGGEQGEAFVVAQYRSFTRGAGQDETVVAVGLHPPGEALSLVEVEHTFGGEGGDHCGEDIAETSHQDEPPSARSNPWVRMRSSWSSIHTSW